MYISRSSSRRGQLISDSTQVHLHLISMGLLKITLRTCMSGHSQYLSTHQQFTRHDDDDDDDVSDMRRVSWPAARERTMVRHPCMCIHTPSVSLTCPVIITYCITSGARKQECNGRKIKTDWLHLTNLHCGCALQVRRRQHCWCTCYYLGSLCTYCRLTPKIEAGNQIPQIRMHPRKVQSINRCH
jgi:hypothetical protein